MGRIRGVVLLTLLLVSPQPSWVQDDVVPAGIDEALLPLATDSIAGMVVFDADGETVVGDALQVVARAGRYYLAMVLTERYGLREVVVPLEDLRFTREAGLTLSKALEARLDALPRYTAADYEALPSGHPLAEVIILPDVVRRPEPGAGKLGPGS